MQRHCRVVRFLFLCNPKVTFIEIKLLFENTGCLTFVLSR